MLTAPPAVLDSCWCDGEGTGGGGARTAGTKGIRVESELFSEQVQIERKIISFDLKENPRGRFLKITEDVGGRRDAVIIPATGLHEIRNIVDRVIKRHDELPPPPPPMEG